MCLFYSRNAHLFLLPVMCARIERSVKSIISQIPVIRINGDGIKDGRLSRNVDGFTPASARGLIILTTVENQRRNTKARTLHTARTVKR